MPILIIIGVILFVLAMAHIIVISKNLTKIVTILELQHNKQVKDEMKKEQD